MDVDMLHQAAYVDMVHIDIIANIHVGFQDKTSTVYTLPSLRRNRNTLYQGRSMRSRDGSRTLKLGGGGTRHKSTM